MTDVDRLGVQHTRFTIQWRESVSAYRVSIPNYGGGEVVAAEDFDRAVEERDKLLCRALRALDGEGRTARHLVARRIEAFLDGEQ
jgi:hypothetical protein